MAAKQTPRRAPGGQQTTSAGGASGITLHGAADRASGYASAARRYLAAGWGSPLPLPPARKKPPPDGWTGYDAPMTSAADVEAWCEEHPGGNIGMRVRSGVIGIDVDAHKGPAELAAWQKLTAELGPLPDAPWCTSRDDAVSGIRLFTVPDGYVAVTVMGPAGEVIQRHHRYVVVPPSVSPPVPSGTGRPYRWTGRPDGYVPAMSDIPPLPQSWLDGLRAGGNGQPMPGFQQPGRGTGWTGPDMDALATGGIPEGVNQDEHLRDLVFDCVRQGMSGPAVRAVWDTAVARTPLTRPGEPWTGADFARHYRGATRKLAPALAAADLNGATPDMADLGTLAERYMPVDWAQAWTAQPGAVDWLLEPMLERGTVNALFAKPGTGKSLLALEIAARLSQDGLTVVYVDDENRVADVVERLQAFGCTARQLGRLRFYSFAGLPALDTPPGGADLLALAVTNDAGLVVLDTTSRMVAGKENDSDTFLQLYRHSLVPLKARGITVLRLDHPGKDIARGQRGSSAKEGDVDTIWRLEQITPTRLRLEREKSRSGHGSGMVELTRRSEPLRHEWGTGGNCPEALVAEKLDRLGVPADAGRPAVRRALAEAGVRVSNEQLTAAIRYRKSCPGQLTDSADSSASGRLSVRTSNRYGQADSAGPGPATPFWCETCKRTHPLAEHQACRDAKESWPDGSTGAEANR